MRGAGKGAPESKMETADTGKAAVAPGRRERMRLAPALPRAAAFVPLIVLTVAFLVYRDRLEGLPAAGYVGIFALNLIGSGTYVLPVPGMAALIAGATVWNPLLVAAAAAVGATVGEVAGYLAGVGSHRVVERLVGGRAWYDRVKRWIAKRGMITLFVFAAIPNPFFDVAGFAAGSVQYPVSRFFLACLLGNTVKFVTVAHLAAWGAGALQGWFA